MPVFSTFGIPFTNFNDYKFINSHFGVTPLDLENFDTAVLLREPLDRVISNFTWFLINSTFNYKDGYAGLSLEQKLRRYLFEDEAYLVHNNLQTKFLTGIVNKENLEQHYRYNYTHENSPVVSPEIFASPQTIYEHTLAKRTEDWFLTNEEFSISAAKSNLDKCLIVGITDRHDEFMVKIFDWIKTNWGFDWQEEFNSIVAEKTAESGFPYYNYGSFTDGDGKTYTSADFRAMLTEAEIAQIYSDNSLDLELYNYAKTK